MLDSIARDCGFEVIPDAKIAAFVRLADARVVPQLVALLERLDEAGLADYAGDISDEFRRAVQRHDRDLRRDPASRRG